MRVRLGFTIVEMLATIAILAVLVALLLPAVQSARETARLTQCLHHVRQIATGWLNHEAQLGCLPSGGWGYLWTGDPDRGAGPTQPGGWAFATLPYLEADGTFQIAAGLSEPEKRVALMAQKTTPMPLFYCPSRRPAAKSYGPEGTYNSDSPADRLVAKTDYAASGGTTWSFFAGPSYPDCLTRYPACSWGPWSNEQLRGFNGVSIPRVGVRVAQIRDGFGQTLMLGEKFLRPDFYATHAVDTCSDNNSLYQGYDWDTQRWTCPSPDCRPSHDSQASDGCSLRFGSPHPAGVNVAMCDGGVRTIAFDVEMTLWTRLGSRADRVPIVIP